jgi:hypothetical protein
MMRGRGKSPCGSGHESGAQRGAISIPDEADVTLMRSQSIFNLGWLDATVPRSGDGR